MTSGRCSSLSGFSARRICGTTRTSIKYVNAGTCCRISIHLGTNGFFEPDQVSVRVKFWTQLVFLVSIDAKFGECA